MALGLLDDFMHVLNPWSFLPENKRSFLGNFPQYFLDVFPSIFFCSFSSALVVNVDILNRHSDFLVFSFLLPISLFSFLYFLGKESTFIFWFYYYYSDLSCSSIKLSPNQTKPKKVLVSPVSVFSFISLKTLVMDCWYCLLYALCFFCLSQFLRSMFLSWNVGSGSGSGSTYASSMRADGKLCAHECSSSSLQAEAEGTGLLLWETTDVTL